MLDKIKEIIKNANFDQDFIADFDDVYDSEYEKLKIDPYAGEYPDYSVTELDEQMRLCVLLKELVTLQEKYQEKGIPLTVFYDSIQDLNYRIKRFYDQNGFYGLSKSDTLWLRFIYFMEIFDLGTLRFQMFFFSYQEIERGGNDALYLPLAQKERFQEGDPIINIHIMNGADLSDDLVSESFELANYFFATYFPEHKYRAYVGRTWLFYPKMLELLSEESNIAKFVKRFEIIATSDNRWQALSRIYGTTNFDQIEKMDKKSSLQKLAYRNLDKLGVGVGVMLKENS